MKSIVAGCSIKSLANLALRERIPISYSLCSTRRQFLHVTVEKGGVTPDKHHKHDKHDHDHDHKHDHGHDHNHEVKKGGQEEEEDEMEEMFILGPAGMEWGGPTRGGRRPEPTRYGDWERQGRVSDFS
eukprot:gene2255-2469_t